MLMKLYYMVGVKIFLFGCFMFIASILISMFLYPSILTYVASGVIARVFEEITVYVLKKAIVQEAIHQEKTINH